ncbi:bifunctional UDP-sugar hydrolase/5'-nucleotidase [Stigmatella sp. ncwal1]|uniref:Bifunctional UDP-sugar hydrolase/5'-nucleotidase n=1 Tax=Stigmatella ashevillensis TaxID=2995309 RepID=A0ABT5DCW2_9BACT|nr:bifunctional UDP-sugar hydrolase/5'-nucleotidase [Stigmatella ashevillena]MDC0711351.1 bifunctional UDP-sugar hydrolase/5'-nucleotidase [Stigmatella ashevillena]
MSSAPEATEPIRLTLVGTNDLHGWIHPNPFSLPDGTLAEEGGLAVFAGYLAILRASNPDGVLLLDGGDLFQGTLASNLGEGAAVIDAYNQLGYHAAAIGNHDFDYGPVGPAQAASRPEMDSLGALKARMAQARFPLLSANLYDAATGQRPEWLRGDGTLLLTLKGVKVGLVGLSTPRTPETTNRLNVAGLRFGELLPETLAAASRLRARGAELVIAVAHIGGQCRAWDRPRDLSSCEPREELPELLQALPPGTLDAVVAGHTHQPLGHFIQGTPVIESRENGRSFGTIELFVDPRTHKVLEDLTVIQPLIPVCARVDETTRQCAQRSLQEQPSVKLVQAMFLGQPVEKDATLEQLLAPALARADAERKRLLGVSVPQALRRHFTEESSLGSVLTDSLRELMRADVALLNAGSMRADLPAGELTYGGVYEMLPFDNTLATLTLTGEQLWRLLEHVYGTARQGVYQLSGLQVELARCPGPGRLKRILLPNGQPVRPERTYRVVMPDFLARGGNGLSALLASFPKDAIDLGLRQELGLRDALIAFWQKAHRPLVAPPPGRMRFVGEGECRPVSGTP